MSIKEADELYMGFITKSKKSKERLRRLEDEIRLKELENYLDHM